MNDPIVLIERIRAIKEIIGKGIFYKLSAADIVTVVRGFVEATAGRDEPVRVPEHWPVYEPRHDRKSDSERELDAILARRATEVVLGGHVETSGAVDVRAYVYSGPAGDPKGMSIIVKRRAGGDVIHDIVFANPTADLANALVGPQDDLRICLSGLDGHD